MTGQSVPEYESQAEMAAELMKAEITALIEDGTIPADVQTFAQLHDYVDANMLADDLFPGPTDEETEEEADARREANADVFNPASDAVNAWLKAGRPKH
jgi:enolase